MDEIQPDELQQRRRTSRSHRCRFISLVSFWVVTNKTNSSCSPGCSRHNNNTQLSAAERHRKHRNRLSAAVWNQQNTATHYSFISSIYFSCDENMNLNIYMYINYIFFNLLYLCAYLFIVLFINSSLIQVFFSCMKRAENK